MRLALLTTDNREHFRTYEETLPWFGSAPAALLQGFEGLPELEVHVVSCSQRQMTSPAKLASNVFFHGVVVPKRGWLRTLYQGCIRAVRARLKEIQPDIVHGQGTERDCSISAVFSGLPNMVTIHGNMRRIARVMRAKPWSLLWLTARLERFTLARTRGVVCITRHTRQEVGSLAKRTWLVPNAVEESFFEVRAEPGRRLPPRIVCVGQIYPLKNQNALIRALDSLAQEHRFELFFLGEANPGQPYAAEFLELVKARPWCIHAGYAGRRQLKAHLREATLLVQPTLEDNCPMAVLEAMAAGLPVLASKAGGLPDLIEEGWNGLFCEPLAPETMRAGVEVFLSQPAKAREMGQCARQRARERFHPRIIARRHFEIYSEVLGSGR
jgi:glycosyltransferase involved in cell wall biosynthesis